MYAGAPSLSPLLRMWPPKTLSYKRADRSMSATVRKCATVNPSRGAFQNSFVRFCTPFMGDSLSDAALPLAPIDRGSDSTRSARANLLDERIDPYQNNGWTFWQRVVIIVELRWGAARYPVGICDEEDCRSHSFWWFPVRQVASCMRFQQCRQEHRLLLPFIKDRFRCGLKAIHVGTPDHLEQKTLSVPLNEFLRQFRHRRACRNSPPAAA